MSYYTQEAQYDYRCVYVAVFSDGKEIYRNQDKVILILTKEKLLFVKALEEHKVPHGRNSYIAQLYIQLYAGFRMGEINTLRSRDVNLEKGHIHVGCTIARGKKYRNFVRPSPVLGMFLFRRNCGLSCSMLWQK